MRSSDILGILTTAQIGQSISLPVTMTDNDNIEVVQTTLRDKIYALKPPVLELTGWDQMIPEEPQTEADKKNPHLQYFKIKTFFSSLLESPIPHIYLYFYDTEHTWEFLTRTIPHVYNALFDAMADCLTANPQRKLPLVSTYVQLTADYILRGQLFFSQHWQQQFLSLNSFSEKAERLQQSADRLMKLGDQLFAREHFYPALAAYKDAAVFVSDEATPLIKQAACLRNLKLYTAAIKTLNQAIPLIPEHNKKQLVACYHLRGNLRMQPGADGGQLPFAISDFEAVLALQPDNQEAKKAKKIAEDSRLLITPSSRTTSRLFTLLPPTATVPPSTPEMATAEPSIAHEQSPSPFEPSA